MMMYTLTFRSCINVKFLYFLYILMGWADVFYHFYVYPIFCWYHWGTSLWAISGWIESSSIQNHQNIEYLSADRRILEVWHSESRTILAWDQWSRGVGGLRGGGCGPSVGTRESLRWDPRIEGQAWPSKRPILWRDIMVNNLRPRVAFYLWKLEILVLRIHEFNLFDCWGSKYLDDLNELIGCTLPGKEWFTQ